ncbi:ribulokinase [Melissococcus plutonius]|uniref:xylulokinase n=1 Tax=Melissococcus plutonius TaxID=33970 RepID=UPI00065E03E1|nr:FGGY-family carbohydrate kinase [Melissococcus plutonius]AIM25087.1 ribulokinase [Melissococcus plutonius S1]KMT25328.1 ribulokinase [Melissococcus plutonius]KMT26233.1 ribulokinase [Melissococcus plutonius]KMT26963.1 ribulokinase [Melissococcus plutonius]KMT28974.1 ribulokinase [Melissococcus plutonius]
MEKDQAVIDIKNEKTSLGIELGSTRIKAVLIDSQHEPIATGSFEWENQLENGYWTYSIDEIWKGIQASYAGMAAEVKRLLGLSIEKIGCIGFSAMMHGYMAFDKDEQLLTSFRTWRNSNTEEAAKILTNLFNFNIPERWSIAHLYQVILDKEAHVSTIDYITTLAGYIHWQLTGEMVLGIGDVPGMFPIDEVTKNYDQEKTKQFNQLIEKHGFSLKLEDIFPKVLTAGTTAGHLTEKGAHLLDPSGNLQAGIPLCPPEGDAGTGMTATKSVAVRTGNVSAGTSIFAMIVLERNLKAVHPEIDLVTTPAGEPVAMVHANNCSSDINAWIKLFGEFANLAGISLSTNQLFQLLFEQALKGEKDCGNMLAYGYFSGENITNIKEGRPLFIRTPESNFNLANFMRLQLFSAVGALKIGMDILRNDEQVQVDKLMGHGGLFKTKDVGQKIVAAAMQAPIETMETAGEGGAWGIALLAAYLQEKQPNESLADFLDHKIFQKNKSSQVMPDSEDVNGFEKFIERYKNGLPIEQAAIDYLK